MRIIFFTILLILAWYFKVNHIIQAMLFICFISSLHLSDLEKTRERLLNVNYNSYNYSDDKIYEKKLADRYNIGFTEGKIDLYKYIQFACLIGIITSFLSKYF